jgi:hypothetical protein
LSVRTHFHQYDAQLAAEPDLAHMHHLTPSTLQAAAISPCALNAALKFFASLHLCVR